jgi:TPR repeat protein
MVYSSGAGVPVDLIEAHKWFNIAAMRGHKDAAQLRREVAEQMKDAEIGCAQRAARDWLKTHPQAPKPVAAIRVAA